MHSTAILTTESPAPAIYMAKICAHLNSATEHAKAAKKEESKADFNCAFDLLRNSKNILSHAQFDKLTQYALEHLISLQQLYSHRTVDKQKITEQNQQKAGQNQLIRNSEKQRQLAIKKMIAGEKRKAQEKIIIDAVIKTMLDTIEEKHAICNLMEEIIEVLEVNDTLEQMIDTVEHKANQPAIAEDKASLPSTVTQTNRPLIRPIGFNVTQPTHLPITQIFCWGTLFSNINVPNTTHHTNSHPVIASWHPT